ncbi:hypothetical protein PYCCODRAFT_1472290 [Trametes coccinea BRFM310]|uniref:BTB domain-containing protein n=1 Tax=Trametes coccinea (strain BRFM310) TaxID=1353009 RepID=A0A1Y2I6Q4_TRAC3|nr:hypothetical protein PYCCODRAFT_1472290 [Trametes coccinea BRFM310]
MPATATSSASSCSSPRTVCREHDKVDGEPPAKRRREEAVTRSSTVWFSDGNIVLIADHKSAFRVHRSVLAHHSSILKATLELTQPEDGFGDTYDGCPVLHVPDPAFDLACLLRALYDGAKFQANRLGARPPFPVVAALVELSHKYDMGHLREEALRRFRLCLPHRFSDFISRVGIVSQQQSQGDGDTLGPTLQSPALHISADRDAIRTANLAGLVDDNRMLPMALYLCAQLSVTALLDGT